jgi:hypothetical protein
MAYIKAQGHEKLQEVVLRGVSNAADRIGVPLEVLEVLSSSSGLPVDNWKERLVGSQGVTVMAAPSVTIMAMLQTMSARLTAMEQREAASGLREAEAWAPRLRNIIAQVLLHACGKQDFRTATEAGYFKKLLMAHDSGLQQLATDMGATTSEVADKADEVLTRHNQHIHPGSLVTLEAEVDAVQRCVTPMLRQLCPQECRFLEAYHHIKAAFPKRFT